MSQRRRFTLVSVSDHDHGRLTVRLSEAVRFLEDQHRGVLATIRTNGMPQVSNVMYSVIDGEIWISVTADRAKTGNARRDPRAVLHVTTPDFGSYVAVECDVSLSQTAGDTSDVVLADLRRLYRSMAGEHPDWEDYDRAMVGDRRLVMVLHPLRAYGMT